MKTSFYHLAQVNIARAIAPLDDPVMAGFVNQLSAINALADASEGFVWRMQSETGDNLYIRPYDDPFVIFNLSVWESTEALKQYVYRTGHAAPLRDRKQSFEKMESHHFALWWIPAGHIPSVEEAKQRLAYRQQHGDSPVAFSFSHAHEMPKSPNGASDQLHEPPRWNYDGKNFFLRSRSEFGDCGGETRFHYRQQGARVWATYEGGGVRFGSLVARCEPEGTLHGEYQHLNANDEFRVGSGISALLRPV